MKGSAYTRTEELHAAYQQFPTQTSELPSQSVEAGIDSLQGTLSRIVTPTA